MSRDKYLEDQLRHDFIQMSSALQKMSEQSTKLQAALDVAREALKLIGGPQEFYCEVGDRNKHIAALCTLSKIEELLK